MQNFDINKKYFQAVRKLYEGGKILQKFPVSKTLRQGCSLAPTLIKVYLQLEEALKSW